MAYNSILKNEKSAVTSKHLVNLFGRQNSVQK